MKTFLGLFIVFVVMVCLPNSVKAQDVTITVPADNIFNRIELNTMTNVLHTDYTAWKSILGILLPTAPTMKSTTQNYKHNTLGQATLRQEVLRWQLITIGGNTPYGGTIPGYKYFTTSDQTWFQPTILLSSHSKGFALFSFKIPTSEYTANALQAGNYSRPITHNYGSGSGRFTPASFNMIISIPEAIKWLSSTSSKYIEITSINDYRSTDTKQLGNLGPAQLGNTLDFNLNAKTSSSLIQITSSKGVTGTREISLIKLGSNNNPKIISSSLSSTWKNHTPVNTFKVETGNRNNFTLDLSIAASDFKTYFYQAGTYTFQLNLDAKSTNNSISALQNTDITLKVLPLSEITIPTSGNAVNFEFNTNTHYQQGLSKVIPNQIKISNNETFELYVKSDATYFKKGGIQTDINANILEVAVNGGNSVPLSPTPQKIINNGSPVLDQKLNIKYTIPPAAAQSLVGREKTTYSINVIYSFTAL